MAKRKRNGFKVGDTARLLTGTDKDDVDNSRYSHERPIGTVVILDRWDKEDDTWLVHEEDRKPYDTYDYWVKWNEIEPDLEPVTDDEIRQLFGTIKEAT